MTYYGPAPRIETELGTERLCRGCGEFWPDVDPEFWFLDRFGRVLGRCRACWSERNRSNHAKRKFGEMVA
jgi:hypothetical protein